MKEFIFKIINKTTTSIFEEEVLQNTKAFNVEKTKNKKFGDFSCNVSMILAPHLKKNPRKIAETIKQNIKSNIIEKIDVAGAGFLNFFLKKNAYYPFLTNIHNEKNRYGKQNIGKNKKVMVEFVSANPTGPLHIGHGRGAVLGDVLSNLLTFFGYNVSKEYDEDELRATMIHWGDPAVIGLGAKNGWIYANESGSGGITRCYICHRGGATYTDALPIKLVRSDVTFEIPEVPPHVGYTDTSIQFNSELTFQYITFDGAPTASPLGSGLFAGANQKATFTYCKFGRDNNPQFLKLQVNQGFTLIVGGYIQPLNKNKAGLSIGAQGYANTRACVIDGKYAGSNAGVRVTLDGIISPNQEIVFRDADFGFATQGGVSTWDRGSTSPHCLRFVEFTGSATCINGVRANTDAIDQYGGVLDLPHLYGRVSADYGVTAINGAQVHMGTDSALTSALGVNFVSADGGISNVSQTQYLTTISGGNVPFTGYETIYSASTPGDWIAPAPSSSQEAIDRIAAWVESFHGAIP